MSSLRRIPRLILTTMGGLFCMSSPSHALSPGDVVDNFRLIDHAGRSHELYYLSDMKAVVLLAYDAQCELAADAARTVDVLRSRHPASLGALIIDSNLADTREAIAAAAAKAGFAIPVLVDEAQVIGESLGFTHSGEALVIDTKGWKVAYRGAAADALGEAVGAVVGGSPVKVARTDVRGCAISMPERERREAHARISYEKDVAPILLNKCVACHREGGIGPWQMTSYEMIKGFAPMIREVVRTQRMPPWHADPHYQTFSNDRGLSKEQVKTLVHWIEAGAPRGSGADPLLTQKKDWPEWPLGKPDLIVETPPFTTPTTGVIPYQNVTVKNPLEKDVWVRAIDYLPGQRAVLHHVIGSAGGAERRGATSLSNYVPGAEPLVLPEEAGILLPAGATFHFQMHYTTNGQALTDVTKLGLYFRNDPPKYNFRSFVLAQPKLKIPAQAKDHVEIAERTFEQDAVIYTVHPHSHFRGKAAKFVAKLPDGREEVLLNVPAYDFNWQATYELVEPITVPAGTKIVYTAWFDNSSQNKANPDPNREITWGEQTWDEMVFGVLRYRNVNEDPSNAPKKDEGPSQERLFSERPAEAANN